MKEIEDRLDSFDADERKAALQGLLEKVKAGQITLPPAGGDVNLHCHTFFSYNAYGYSPSRYAWLARKAGLAVAGIVDFDVLAGLAEFLQAGRLLNLKTIVGLETRVFVPEFADKVMNSPGEPGIVYYMGAGFSSSNLEGKAGEFQNRLFRTTQKRNRELMGRVNQYLSPVELDYDKDVLPLTPEGNATERHLCQGYARKAKEIYPDDFKLAGFWADKLGVSIESLAGSLPEAKELLNLIRAKTMKRGGVGYVAPDSGSFPLISEMNEFVLAADGIPTYTWLDGTNDGEKEIEKLLEVAMSSGCAAINIIPDRNYTEDIKDEKLANLYSVVELAEKLHLPVIVGTEMNSPGQKFVDSFDSKELSKLMPVFVKGAHIIYGHCVLQRQCRLGYTSQWAKDSFTSIAEKNNFFQQIGKNLQPNQENFLSQFNTDTSPTEILKQMQKTAFFVKQP